MLLFWMWIVKNKWCVSQVQSYMEKRKVLGESLLSNMVFLSCNTPAAPVVVSWCVSGVKETWGKNGEWLELSLLSHFPQEYGSLVWLTCVVIHIEAFTDKGKYKYHHSVHEERGRQVKWGWLGLMAEFFMHTQPFHGFQAPFPFRAQVIL